MASSGYTAWLKAGRPLDPAQPVRDVVDRMKVAYPKAASSFSWYANDEHYKANPPQDHTPYSTDGWPVPSPRWVVFATDVMHNPAAGVDCNVLFPHWLTEARAGRFPGLKYLIWQARIYDARHGWVAQTSAGHFDHIHLSFRSDARSLSLGAWSLLPVAAAKPEPPKPKDDDMTIYAWLQQKDKPNELWACANGYRWHVGTGAAADITKRALAARGIAWADEMASLEDLEALAPILLTEAPAVGLTPHTHDLPGTTGAVAS